ncbi:MAG TPA: fluoride efflux transporter CrcB [candidate division Zixibacteria bacterium]|nr:fluoride efflux transporter CrcB [candidate division Zixibacteria bacterium]
MGPLLLIGAGGFAGAIARYLVDLRVSDWTGGSLPWGTFVINVSGSFVVGLVFALVVERAVLPAEVRGPLMVGFIGAFTTFSTLTLESWRMLEDGLWLYASANLVGSIVLGVLAVVAGVALGRAM